MNNQNFIAYLLHAFLLETRENALSRADSRSFYLADMLHNAPFSVIKENTASNELTEIELCVKKLNIPEWFNARKKEFEERTMNITLREDTDKM